MESGDDRSQLSPDALGRLLKPELKEMCRERSLNVSGNKSDLVRNDFSSCMIGFLVTH